MSYYLDGFMAITGYIVWIGAIISICFSLIANKLSDRRRKNREYGEDEIPSDFDCNVGSRSVHIVRSGRGRN